jgi:hypothetical protein
VATDVTSTEVRTGVGPAEEEAQPKPYWRRFLVVYVILALAAVAGIVALIFVTTDDTTKHGKSFTPTGERWSAWQPTGSTISGLTQNIARHVSQKYEGLGLSALPVARNPASNEPPIVAIEFRSRFGTFQQPRRLVLRLASAMWMYELCGQSGNCGITSRAGELGQTQNLLVYKEILELALYTLKYAPRLDSVLVVVPGDQSSLAFYLHRRVARRALQEPLTKTVPPGRQKFDKRSFELFSRHLWVLDTNQIRQLPDTSIILELDKPPNQGR